MKAANAEADRADELLEKATTLTARLADAEKVIENLHAWAHCDSYCRFGTAFDWKYTRTLGKREGESLVDLLERTTGVINEAAAFLQKGQVNE